MSVSLPAISGPFRQFSDWVRSNQVIGLSSSGHEVYFVRPQDQQIYWTDDRILEVTNTLQEADQPVPRTIRESFVQIFSTLVIANAVQFLKHFTEHGLDDGHMPLTDFPVNKWHSKSDIDNSLYQKLQNYQWQFFPQFFDSRLSNKALHKDTILPIRSREKLLPGRLDRISSSTIYKIEVDETCHDFKSTDGRGNETTTPNTFVLKVYDSATQSDQYLRERTALNALQNRDRNVVYCFGSFTQDGTSNILLEYANGGDLLQLFTEREPPQSGDDVVAFWESMLKIIKGVGKIHNIHTHVDQFGRHLCGIHGDLKPDNILLNRYRDMSEYCFEPKIADFGNSDIHRGTAEGEGMGQDQECDREYSAPERCRCQKFLRNAKIPVSGKVDLFSLGCIFAEACVWVCRGPSGLKDFRSQRVAEIDQALRDGGYEGCFYSFRSGQGYILRCVSKQLEAIAEMPSTAPCHLHTSKVSQLVLQSMLKWQPNSREPVSVLMNKLQSILDEARQIDLELQSPLTPRTSPDSARRQLFSLESLPAVDETSTPPTDYSISTVSPSWETSSWKSSAFTASPRSTLTEALPFRQSKFKSKFSRICGKPRTFSSVSIKQVLDYRAEMKRRNGERKPNEETGRILEQLKDDLQGREQIFFIDNSCTMAAHKEEINRAFDALGWIAESIDKNEIELYFGNPQENCYKHVKSSELLKILKAQKYSDPGAPSMMESSLSDLVEGVIKPELRNRVSTALLPGFPFFSSKMSTVKKMNIFVFTDGIWSDNDDGKAAGVEAPIKSLIDEIRQLKLLRTQVTVQFVRFGRDKAGIRRLRYLDDEVDTEFDIVDTEPVGGNVYKMFISSTHRDMDKVETPLDGYNSEDNLSSQTWYTAPESRSRASSWQKS